MSNVERYECIEQNSPPNIIEKCYIKPFGTYLVGKYTGSVKELRKAHTMLVCAFFVS